MSEDPTRGHGFDELARSLAEGSISRRRALKLFAGTAIAALIPLGRWRRTTTAVPKSATYPSGTADVYAAKLTHVASTMKISNAT
jgi:hypothetical protein